ncbi:hypothetical protein, partial [Bradyrhizobium sp. 76]|uniref:hypothetical protein n=1 Tax=Bradyrhizobium sp. 76 TaxID=2782680 RepID=UPI001FF70EEA
MNSARTYAGVIHVSTQGVIGGGLIFVHFGFWPILLQKSAAMDLAAGPFVEPRSEALALTHFTQ